MLLSRVADSIYWGARYLERAEDTARVVRSYTDVIVDLPTTVSSSWTPLLAILGNGEHFTASPASERDIVRFLTVDDSNPGSIVSSISGCRRNLRSTREVMPREAWHAVNDLHLHVSAQSTSAVERRGRARFLGRVIEDSQRVDGVLTAAMTRDEAYEFWRLGQALERADMTTRVLGVRATGLLESTSVGEGGRDDAVQWMGVLRSLSALQMYQRSVRGPISGADVVDFLLHDTRFPRSVAHGLMRIREALGTLPGAATCRRALERAEAALSDVPFDITDGRQLDDATDRLQLALAEVHLAVTSTYLDGGDVDE